MTRNQVEMFERPVKAPTPRIKRAHVIDAGEGMEGYPYGAKFCCVRCEWESGWICFDNVPEMKRGIACENCN